jgi:putative transposase
MLRTFELRLKPTASQRSALANILADSCETYNAALQERRDAWKLHRKSVGYYEQQKQLTELRKDPQYSSIAVDIQREPLRRVDRAFKAFFRRCKSGDKPGYPRFKPRDSYDSFAWHDPKLKPEGLQVPNLGCIRFKYSRMLEGKLKTSTVVRTGGKWAARITCDIGPAPEKKTVSSAIGIDVGLTALAALSDGSEIENPRWTKRHEDKIVAANQTLARKKRGSKNRIRAKEALRRVYQRAANCRKNYLHNVSKWIVSQYDLIAYESLKIGNMTKSNLAKSIMDAAWGILLFQIRYKAESAGAYAIAVNPWGTSQNCSGCGVRVPKELSDRRHDCPKCGLSLGRDHNAGRNILALGMSAAGFGPSECVREDSCI